MKRWLASDIGCIECGEGSGVIGVFLTEAEAKTACEKTEEEQRKDWHGQHSMEVFELYVPEG